MFRFQGDSFKDIHQSGNDVCHVNADQILWRDSIITMKASPHKRVGCSSCQGDAGVAEQFGRSLASDSSQTVR